MIKKNTMAKPIMKKKPMTLDDFAGAHPDGPLTYGDERRYSPDHEISKGTHLATQDGERGREDDHGIMVSKADLANTLGDELAKSRYTPAAP